MCNQSQSENIFTFVRNQETFDLDEDSFIERILTESPIEVEHGCGENFTQSFNKNSGLISIKLETLYLHFKVFQT
jgi:hypothetical protein